MRIKIYTTRRCGDCLRTKSFLSKLEIPFDEVDIDEDETAAAFVMAVNQGRRSVPTVVYGEDAASLSNFSREKLDSFLERNRLLARSA